MDRATSIQYTSSVIRNLLQSRSQQKRDNHVNYKQAVIDVEKQRKLEPQLVREFSSRECYLNNGIISTSLSLKSKKISEEKPTIVQSGSTSSLATSTSLMVGTVQPDIFPKDVIVQSRDNIDAKEVKSTMRQKFNDSEVMSASLCLARSVYLDLGMGRLSYIERIRDEITNLRNIGEGFHGSTYTTDVKFKNESSDLFVIKAPKDPQKKDELIHEIAVCMFSINELRNYIPHFSMIFGGFDCSAPITDTKGSVVTWCNSDSNSVTYALCENIHGILLEDYLYSCSIDEFISVYLQIIYSLIFAYNICGFTHYDLHLGNVIIHQATNKPVWVAFPSTGLKNDPRKTTHWIYSPSGVIPVFIDYGRTHIQLDYKGQEIHLGYAGDLAPLYDIGVDQNHANIMGDIYKITCLCLTALKLRNKGIFNQVTSLLSYFNKSESPSLIIENQNRLQFPLPLDAKQSVDAGPPENFLTKILRDNPKFNRFITSIEPKEDILRIESGQIKARQVLSDFGITDSLITPKSFVEFYDLHSLYEVTERTSIMLSLEKEFSKLIDAAWIEEQKKQISLLKIIEKPYVDQIPGIDFTEGAISIPLISYLSDSKFLQSYEKFTTQVGEYINSWQKLLLSIKATEYIGQIFDSSVLLNASTLLKKNLSDRKKWIETYSSVINYIYPTLFPSTREDQIRLQRIKEAIMRSKDSRRILRMWDNFYILKGVLEDVIKETSSVLDY